MLALDSLPSSTTKPDPASVAIDEPMAAELATALEATTSRPAGRLPTAWEVRANDVAPPTSSVTAARDGRPALKLAVKDP